jgi:c-di-GMP-binding flagellar brake protein YcgR
VVVLPDNKANPQDSSLETVVEAKPSSYILICERDQITQILQQLIRMQTSLAIQLATPEGTRDTQSTVLRIDNKPKPGQVVLHQPDHASWYGLLKDKPDARINCYLPNGRLTFSTQLAPLETIIEGSFFCRFPLPNEIRKYQLRGGYRVSVSPGSSMIMLLLADHRIGGECLDFSIGGCCLVFQADLSDHLQENSQLSNLVINLGGIADFTVDVKVCRISTTKSGRLIIGAQYLDLTPQQQSRLQTALIQLQRQQLQKKVRLT